MTTGRGPLFVTTLVAALAVVAPAAGDPIGDKAAVDARIAGLESRVDASRQNEGVLTSQLSAVTSELRASESAVESAQASLDRLETQLGAQRARLRQLNVRLEAETRRLEQLRLRYRRSLAVLAQRVRDIYVEDSPDLLSFLVSASSFSDLLDDYDYLGRIGRQDERVAAKVRAAKEEAAAERRRTLATRRLTAATARVIASRMEEARSVRDRLAAGRDSLAAAQRLKASSLANVRETRAAYLSEVNALQAQSAALAEAIRNAQAGSASTSSGVSLSGLIWPVQGPITSSFGLRWGRMHEGIDIAVPTGTPVHAAAAGLVIYASWMTGYGNLVVVDHGNGLATAYAHNSSVLVAVGEQVAQGQAISLSGSTGHSTGPHVHFEVRVNGVAVDPLRYL